MFFTMAEDFSWKNCQVMDLKCSGIDENGTEFTIFCMFSIGLNLGWPCGVIADCVCCWDDMFLLYCRGGLRCDELHDGYGILGWFGTWHCLIPWLTIFPLTKLLPKNKRTKLQLTYLVSSKKLRKNSQQNLFKMENSWFIFENLVVSLFWLRSCLSLFYPDCQ